MDLIYQYQELCDIKPEYHKLYKPYHKNSMKKAIFNLEEIELIYNKKGVYYPPKKGGKKNEKVTIILAEF